MNQSTRTRASSSSSQIQKKGIRKYSSDYYDSDASDSEQIIKKRVVKIWTPDEDEMLQQFYEQFNGNWTQVALSIPGRNASQCSQRWKRINPNRTKLRKQWTEDEDRQVLRLIQKFGKNWKRIENEMTGRSGKQIRERFINKLDKAINHEPFTEEEDSQIYNLYEKMGAKWSEISKMLQGRPENMVKNRFYSHIKKFYNIQTKESDSDGKEIVPQQQKQQNQQKENSHQNEQGYNGEKKLDTIQSQFDYENSLNNNQVNNNNILFPNCQSFLKADSLNSNSEFQLYGHQMSLEQKQLYQLDQSGSQIYQEIQFPQEIQEILDDQEQIIKKTSNYFRADNENGENQMVYQFGKMSIENE